MFCFVSNLKYIYNDKKNSIKWKFVSSCLQFVFLIFIFNILFYLFMIKLLKALKILKNIIIKVNFFKRNFIE